MPDYPTSPSRFLTAEERKLACTRLAMDGMGLTQAAHKKVSEWAALKMTVRDWRTWALCFLFMLGTGAQTMQYFLPSIVETLGWEGHQAQCMADFSFFRNMPLCCGLTFQRYDYPKLRFRSCLHIGRLLHG